MFKMYKDMMDTIGFVKNADSEVGTAMESELMALRIILTGRLMGISTEALRGRLRDSYV